MRSCTVPKFSFLLEHFFLPASQILSRPGPVSHGGTRLFTRQDNFLSHRLKFTGTGLPLFFLANTQSTPTVMSESQPRRGRKGRVKSWNCSARSPEAEIYRLQIRPLYRPFNPMNPIVTFYNFPFLPMNIEQSCSEAALYIAPVHHGGRCPPPRGVYRILVRGGQ